MLSTGGYPNCGPNGIHGFGTLMLPYIWLGPFRTPHHQWHIYPPASIPQPTITQPTITQPTITQPTITQPTIIQPTIIQPRSPQPTITQPRRPQPTITQPTITQPTITQPTITQPIRSQPMRSQPRGPQPRRPQPTITQPIRSQPTRPQPTRPQPTRSQPRGPQPTRPQPTRPQPRRYQPTIPQPARPKPSRPQNWFSHETVLRKLPYHHKDVKYVIEKMHETIRHESVHSYNIKLVSQINNSYLWERYTRQRRSICKDLGGAYVEEKRLFHGSSQADKIALKGFDRRFAKESGMFGSGIYFAEHSSKSNQYASGPDQCCIQHKRKECSVCIHKMLICKVALGRQYKTYSEMKYLPRGYDSIKACAGPELIYPEYVIYNEKQVYPSYLVEYTVNYR